MSTPAARKARQRERERAAGLVRVEFAIPRELVETVKAAVAKILKDAQK